MEFLMLHGPIAKTGVQPQTSTKCCQYTTSENNVRHQTKIEAM